MTTSRLVTKILIAIAGIAIGGLAHLHDFRLLRKTKYWFHPSVQPVGYPGSQSL